MLYLQCGEAAEVRVKYGQLNRDKRIVNQKYELS